MGNKKLLTMIKTLLGLEADVGYKAWGEYYTELRMVAFRVDAFQIHRNVSKDLSGSTNESISL